MTQRKQQGFSIIELLIVVAIIAILILVALPQYKKYILRAQVSEAMSLAAGPKTELGVIHAEYGEFPNTVTTSVAAGIGKYINTSSVTVDSTNKIATIEYEFDSDTKSANAEINGEKIQIIGTIDSDGNLGWTCKATTSGSKVDKSLPSACKN